MVGLSVASFSELTTVLFSAALGQSKWEDFLDRLSSHSGDICTHLIGFDTEAGIALDMAASGYDPDYIDSYRSHFATQNPWAEGFVSHDVGVAVDCEEMCPTEKMVRTEFYNDWLRPQDEIMHGGGALLFKDDTRLFALGGNIRRRDAEKLNPGWMRSVQQLLPQTQQAFEVSRALAGAKLETAIIAREGLRAVPGIVILSEEGRVVFANELAQSMLDAGDPIAFDRTRRLCFGNGANNRILSKDFLKARLTEPAPSFSLVLSADAVGRTHELRFVKLTADAGIPLPLEAALRLSGPCTVLIISTKERGTDEIAEVSSRWGLTVSEATVALMIASGLSPREISETRETSIHTVRYQVKAVMGKLGVRRQAEIVREIQKLR